MDGFVEKPFDNKEQSVSHDELMIRRIKNRERQRRYRARKRLEADMNKAQPDTDSNQYILQHVVPAPVTPHQSATPLNTTEAAVFPANQCCSTVVPPEVAQESPSFQEPVTRVYCARDWKRDARKAHVLKQQQVRSDAAHMTPESSSSNGNQPSLSDSNESAQAIPSRRHWKAEARSKKS